MKFVFVCLLLLVACVSAANVDMHLKRRGFLSKLKRFGKRNHKTSDDLSKATGTIGGAISGLIKNHGSKVGIKNPEKLAAKIQKGTDTATDVLDTTTKVLKAVGGVKDVKKDVDQTVEQTLGQYTKQEQQVIQQLQQQASQVTGQVKQVGDAATKEVKAEGKVEENENSGLVDATPLDCPCGMERKCACGGGGSSAASSDASTPSAASQASSSSGASSSSSSSSSTTSSSASAASAESTNIDSTVKIVNNLEAPISGGETTTESPTPTPTPTPTPAPSTPAPSTPAPSTPTSSGPRTRPSRVFCLPESDKATALPVVSVVAPDMKSQLESIATCGTNEKPCIKAELHGQFETLKQKYAAMIPANLKHVLEYPKCK